jgi:hypothetical protein
MGAMLNISRPYWPSGSVKVLDPFVGSGTTFLETLKDPRIELTGYDIEPIAPLIGMDNLLFFGSELSGLERWRDCLKVIIENLQSQPQSADARREWKESPEYAYYKAARKILSRIKRNQTGNLTISEQDVAYLKKSIHLFVFCSIPF